HRQVETGLDAVLGDVEIRRIRETVERNDVAQWCYEAERPAEHDAVVAGCEDNVDIGLAPRRQKELDLVHLQSDEWVVADQLQTERADRTRHQRRRLLARLGRCLHLDRQVERAAGLGVRLTGLWYRLEDRSGCRPWGQLGRPVQSGGDHRRKADSVDELF